MNSILAYILIALIKTPGEGGTVQIETETYDKCEYLGTQIEERFESHLSANGVYPRVLWECIPVGTEGGDK